MLPQIILDDEKFSEITDAAVRRIPGLCPEWTDYNLHDPGITIIELFAWLKELQQFHLDRTGAAQLPKYLKFMGLCLRGSTPAEAELLLENLQTPAFYPKGSRFFAGDVCFETTESAYFDPANPVKLAHGKRSEAGDIRFTDMTDVGKGLRFQAFGGAPQKGDILAVGLNGPLTPGKEQRLCLHFFSGASGRRNPVSDGNGFDDIEAQPEFFPLAEYTVSYCTKRGHRRAVIGKDTTHQMLFDGVLSFFTGEEMEKERDGLYWLYIELQKSEYDLAPVIEEISLSRLHVRQIRTLSESYTVSLEKEYITIGSRLAFVGACMCFLSGADGYFRYKGTLRREEGPDGVRFYMPKGPETADRESALILLYEPDCREKIMPGEGNGMPFFSCSTGVSSLCGKGLAILGETEKGSGAYRFWEARPDFDASGPADRHYCLDEETGTLFFGDCDHGLAPEGNMILAAAATTLGAEGNVKAGSICRIDETADTNEEQREIRSVRNDRDAAGGADRETPEECRKRMQQRQKIQTRAVTCKDFESLVRQTPGLAIENVKAIPASEQETVLVIVKPYSSQRKPAFGPAYRKNILHMLERRRMIGTNIKVLPPEYTEVTIFIEAGADGEHAKERIRERLTTYFLSIQAEFGVCISYSAVYGMIDVLDCVSVIKCFSMDARGKNVRRSRNGDLLLPVNGLACLEEINCAISPERKNGERL